MNDPPALLLLTGKWSPKTAAYQMGWCTREHYCLRCNLCGGKVDTRDVTGHGRRHIEAIEGQYASFWVVLSMAQQGEANLDPRNISDAIEGVFGFLPGTPEAKQFWKEHGGTKP